MALAFTWKSSIYSSSNATSYTAAPTWTPGANTLLVAFVGNQLAATPLDPTSVTGHGLMYTKVDSLANSTHRLGVWVAHAGASPTSTACVASWGAVTQSGGDIIEFEVTGWESTGTALAAIVQAPTNSGTGTSGTVALAAAGFSANRPMAGFVHLAAEVHAPRTNWSTLTLNQNRGSHGSPNAATSGQYRSDAFETTASASWTSSVAWLGIAIEIKEAGATGGGGSTTVPVFVHHLRQQGIL